jgi:hypothetical protein
MSVGGMQHATPDPRRLEAFQPCVDDYVRTDS